MVLQERQELYKTIWNIANKLRGSVDGWDFKNYVFCFMFYRFISEEFCKFVKSRFDVSEDFNYAKSKLDETLLDQLRQVAIEEKGYFIHPDDLFENVRNHCETKENLNADLDKIFKKIENSTVGTESEKKFAGLFSNVNLDDDNLGEGFIQRKKTLVNLLTEIGNMQLKSYETDIFGDAFEYLMTLYASNAGKSGGEFYTPPEVSELLVKLVSSQLSEISTVYDPTCGSGSLLLKFLKINNEGKQNNIQFFGQEINPTTYNLCRMNMFLHCLNYEEFDICLGDTLLDDKFRSPLEGGGWKVKRFDAIVSNPPYSLKWDGKDEVTVQNDERFIAAGAIAPKSAADLAFIQHTVYHLNNHGVAAIVCFPGILYRERAEKEIRKWLLQQNHVDAVIQMPTNLFFGTTIATCVMVLKKTRETNNVLFIDGSSFFKKVTNRNILEPSNIESILNLYKDRKDVEYLSKVVTPAEIEERGFNLSVEAYVPKEEVKEEIDIEKLNAEIPIRRKRIMELWDQLDEIVKKIEEEND